MSRVRTAFALAAFCVLPAFAGAPNLVTPGQSLPSLKLKASDGSIATLPSLSAPGATTLLVFFKQNCGGTPGAVPYVKALSGAFANSKNVRVRGVIDLGVTDYPRWKKQFKPNFGMLFDTDRSFIRSFGLKHSLVFVAVRNGKALKVWDGYSKTALREMSMTLATAQGRSTPALDFSKAPSKATYG